MQTSVIELAKVSKLLIASEKGQVHKYYGKSLDEICLSDLTDVGDDGGDDSGDDNGGESSGPGNYSFFVM